MNRRRLFAWLAAAPLGVVGALKWKPSPIGATFERNKRSDAPLKFPTVFLSEPVMWEGHIPDRVPGWHIGSGHIPHNGPRCPSCT